ncbi:portal protein [Rhodoferax sp.]|uniref:portal protein n=1 Tax=Rhodoferax sp. TaxID=50421 RepID=UPI002ACE1579|nr:portal protein [Rhodoferax sp.]MDZ7919976.1 portal protein [Rhodoferax sp.]
MTSMDAHDTRAEQDQRRWDELKTDRAEHEQMWENIARLFRPQRGGFGLSNPADRRHEKPLSSAPIHAQNNFAAGLYDTLSNPANQWGGLETNDPDDQQNHEHKLWLDDTASRILASFAAVSQARFTHQCSRFMPMWPRSEMPPSMTR